MSTPSARRGVALALAVSALMFVVAGLYLLLATELTMIGGVLVAVGVGDALISVFMLRGS